MRKKGKEGRGDRYVGFLVYCLTSQIRVLNLKNL